MRYALVSETYPPEVNGVALTVQGLALGLAARGHVVQLVRPRQPGDAGDDGGPELEQAIATVRTRGVALPWYPGLRVGLPAAGILLRHWRQAPPDAIYVATEGPLGWSALRVAGRLGIPAASGFHTRFDHYMRDYGMPWLERAALAWMRRFHNRGDATLVPTEELRLYLHERGFQRVARLARAVDTTVLDPAMRDEALRMSWGAGGNALVVVHVGRIAAEKNLGLAVRAFRALQAHRPDARMVWVGDGPARAALEQAHPDFIYCGVRRGAELARYFASADLFLFPSRSETFGNVTLEAMASGVATVAFDSGAAREHLRDGLHGALVVDESGFVDAARRLACDDQGRRAMGRAARDAVRRLRPQQVAADFDALLAALARHGGHGAAPAV